MRKTNPTPKGSHTDSWRSTSPAPLGPGFFGIARDPGVSPLAIHIAPLRGEPSLGQPVTRLFQQARKPRVLDDRTNPQSPEGATELLLRA